MDSTLKVRIILPSHILATLDATMVIVPGSEGIFGVLPRHMKFISSIDIGLVKVHIDSAVKNFFVYGGIAEVSTEQLNIITEFAALLEESEKHKIINKISELEMELNDKDKNSIDAEIINNKISIHKSLLEFVINK